MLITAVGILSAQNIPGFVGVESFKGESFHTARWPKERVDFTGKRVGVIGTGATAVQLITEIAKEVGHLTVFQRTANYCAPLRNGPIDAETQAKIKASYPEIFKRTRETFAGFIHDFDPRSVFDVSPEERQARFEELWAQPGFSKWLGNFRDIMSDKKANELFAEFVRNKIRERVKDPVVAEKLMSQETIRSGPSASLWRAATTSSSIATMSCWSICASRQSSASRPRASRPATPSTNSTSSSMRPVSTP